MGGDFMMDKEGVVKYIYCSQKSTDRPSVQEILDNLKVGFFVSRCIILWSIQFSLKVRIYTIFKYRVTSIIGLKPYFFR